MAFIFLHKENYLYITNCIFALMQRFSNCEAHLPRWVAGETKILHKVKGTGACRRSKNKGKLVIVV